MKRLMRSLGTKLFAAAALPASIVVCPDCETKTLAQAVMIAPPGAEVVVRAGEYPKTSVVIDKKLKIRGEGNPVLDGRGTGGPILVIAADGVEVSGFTLQNTDQSYTQEIAGVRVREAHDCVIENNKFRETTFGIYLEKAEGCHIKDNDMSAKAINESSSGNGIHAWNGARHVIEGNKIRGHRDGIYFEFIKESKISRNDVGSSLRYGLHFMHSSSNEYLENVFAGAGAGAAIMFSNHVTMKGNKFLDGHGAAAYGLLLKDISDSHIEGNVFADNTVGVFMEGATRSKFVSNEFSSNGWALKITGSCDSNEFTRNDFIGNTFDASTNTELSFNDFKQNYWSRYSGYDLNHDGIGDVPFRPVRLSSVILDRTDSAFIVLNSFLLTLLDEIERALPGLIPERLKDESPMMKRNLAWKK